MISNSKTLISLKKLIIIFIISFIYIPFSPLSDYAKDKVNIYDINGEGCSHASNNPTIPEDSTNNKTEDTACCYVEIEKIPRAID